MWFQLVVGTMACHRHVQTDGSIGYSNDSGGDDGINDDSDTSATPPIKRHKVSGTYWW
jgi:hypothetical protein